MMRLVLGVAVVGLATAGCGQKGALYLPPKNGTVVTRPTGAGQQQPQDKNKDKDKKDEGQPAQQPQ
jgi:predicted small lipoprotein YifL